jgi:NAD(P)H-dependent FMN reductase
MVYKIKKTMVRIAIIIGSTRPGRIGESVGRWAMDIARKRSDAEFELVDIAEFKLPLYDEPMTPSAGPHSHDHTKLWSAKIASFDGFVFVTPEYNHSTCGALKNAIDYLEMEWANKAAGFIGYGYTMGARAVEHLRLILAALQVATVRAQVGLSIFIDFENFSIFKPGPKQEKYVHDMLDQLIAWSSALYPLRKHA